MSPMGKQVTATRAKTLARDRQYTQAISEYISTFRDSLLKDLPKRMLKDRHTKRNELCRLGRLRFKSEPESVQQNFLSQVIKAEATTPKKHKHKNTMQELPGKSGGQVVRSDEQTLEKSGGQVFSTDQSTSCKEDEKNFRTEQHEDWDFDASDLEQALADDLKLKTNSSSLPQQVRMASEEASHSADGPHTSHTQDDPLLAGLATTARQIPQSSAVKHIIAKHLPWLCKRFGISEGAEIFASANRFSSFMDDAAGHSSPDILGAALVGLAAKMSLSDAKPCDVKGVWEHIGGKANQDVIKNTEARIYLTWARKGLQGEYIGCEHDLSEEGTTAKEMWFSQSGSQVVSSWAQSSRGPGSQFVPS